MRRERRQARGASRSTPYDVRTGPTRVQGHNSTSSGVCVPSSRTPGRPLASASERAHRTTGVVVQRRGQRLVLARVGRFRGALVVRAERGVPDDVTDRGRRRGARRSGRLPARRRAGRIARRCPCPRSFPRIGQASRRHSVGGRPTGRRPPGDRSREGRCRR
jgi:hypothetical protein